MGRPILLLRLDGPLQSWGIRARWSRRDTGSEPTKSGIIGLLGCAAGIRRHDWRVVGEPDRRLEEWDRALCFGVRADRPGIIETDYHTVQGRHWQADGKMKTAVSPSGAKREKAMKQPPHTEITWRDYLHDAAFLVALASADSDLLRRLAGASEHPDWPGDLGHPQWPLYLGRKSCVPARPVLDRLTEEYDDVESALRKEPLTVPSGEHNVKGTLEAWVECPRGNHERPDALRINQLRFYDYRRCRRVEIDVASLSRSPS